MKHILFTFFLSTVFLICNAQIASRILVTQSAARDTFPDNYTFIDNTPGAMNRWWVAKWDSVKIKPWNIKWLNDSVIVIGDSRYAKLAGSYTDPSFIQSLSSSKVFGLSPVALSGSYSDLSGTPNMSNFYPSSNPNGYISGITGPMVIGALNYTPYDASNPNNYITASSLNTKQNYADTSTWDVTMTTLEQQRFLKNLDTFSLSHFANDVGYITGITYNDVIGALGVVPLVQEVDGDTLNEIQSLTKTGTNISLSKANSVSINDNDSSNTNELQTLSIVNRIITLSNAGGTVTIPYQSFDSLTNKPTTLSGYGITDGVTTSTLSGYATTSALNGKMNYSDTTSLSNRINTKQNQLNGTGLVRMTGAIVSYDNSTYLTGITSGQVTTALGYTPLRGSDTVSLSNRINAVAPSFNNTPARSLNTSFQISTTRNARVTYSITHTVNLTLGLGSGSTTAFLEISPNNSTWTEINRAGYSKTLAVAVSAGDATTNNLVGDVPAGWWCRIRVVGTGGGLTSSVPNVTYNSGQEVQY